MKLIIIDDHPLVLKGLTTVLAAEKVFQIVGQANSSEEALKLISDLRPDIVIVDIRLGQEYGLDIIEKAREMGCENCRFVVLTSSSNIQDFKKANELLIDGYISKEALPEEFLTAVRMIKKGRKFFDPELVENFLKKNISNPLYELTAREQEVLMCLGRGMSNRDIAGQLFITEYTVKKHVSQILEKLNLSDRTQAALFAVEHHVGTQRINNISNI